MVVAMLSLVVISMFLVGCTEKKVSDAELEAQLSELSDTELDQAIQTIEAEDTGALAGQAYMKGISTIPRNIPKERFLKTAYKIRTLKIETKNTWCEGNTLRYYEITPNIEELESNEIMMSGQGFGKENQEYDYKINCTKFKTKSPLPNQICKEVNGKAGCYDNCNEGDEIHQFYPNLPSTNTYICKNGYWTNEVEYYCVMGQTGQDGVKGCQPSCIPSAQAVKCNSNSDGIYIAITSLKCSPEGLGYLFTDYGQTCPSGTSCNNLDSAETIQELCQ